MPDLLLFLRGLHLVCLASLLGALVLPLAVASGAGTACAAVRPLARASLGGAVITLLLWLLAQTAAFVDADPGDWGKIAVALPAVVTQTRFGHILMLRLALLLTAQPMLGRGRAAWTFAAVAAAAAFALQAEIGHAGAAGGSIGTELQASEALHLIAAGAWLGGLLPLVRLQFVLPQADAIAAARRFAWIGVPAVLVLIATALVQGEVLIGGVGGLFGSAYGRTALVKIGLFAALIAIALLNRFVLVVRAGAGLSVSIGAEALLGAAVLFAAAALAGDEPGAHVEPLWPFPLRPSLAALAEPELRGEILIGAAFCALGALAVAAGLAWRRGRWPLLGVGTVTLWLAAPHLEPLLVEAYPTSYFVSPTGFSAASILRGQQIYGAHCAPCHGVDGRGDGPRAASLPVPPTDLTAKHLREQSDGELFWWLTHGIDSPEGGLSMPGFADSLSEDDRWAVIDFIRANNARLAGITPPLQATLSGANGHHHR
ncbi:MAG: CopD family protein [Proteobacteria bacterium]|nr:CopD family protein [Pseudomonadota bacterium]